jgi:hypothetical protein
MIPDPNWHYYRVKAKNRYGGANECKGCILSTKEHSLKELQELGDLFFSGQELDSFIVILPAVFPEEEDCYADECEVKGYKVCCDAINSKEITKISYKTVEKKLLIEAI